jgi:hypothetical protein
VKGDEANMAEIDAEYPLTRHIFSKLAAHWHELADRVERQEAAADTGEPLQQPPGELKSPAVPRTEKEQSDAER